ncbi:MAG: right-handed parallel beta-helix repeat-containing protein [Candidatus Heimdallarchaeota archaeon]
MTVDRIIVSFGAVLVATSFFLALVPHMSSNHDLKYPQGNLLFAEDGTESDRKTLQNSQALFRNALNINSETVPRPQIMTPESVSLQTYLPHQPIAISSDEFASVGFPGAGTAADPYRIDGWNISTSSVHGIFIHNTTSHFVISNCWVNIASIDYNGIYVSNVAECTATVMNNIITNSHTGIRLEYSSSSTITQNIVTQAHESAIVLHAANSNTLTWNNASFSRVNGLALEKSANNAIFRNIMQSNGRYGVILGAWSSDWNAGFESSNLNIMKWNAFIGNNGGLSQGYDVGETNVFSHNYWDDWTLDDHPDSDGNGIIDEPYQIADQSILVDNNQDLYPLANFSRVVDSDGDGMDDYYESVMGLDPTSNDGAEDLDLDELTNLVEYTLGTAPNDPDTDADGLADGTEVNEYGSNPFISDTDGDGLADGAEVNTFHTHPVKADTDGDGLADGAEVNTYHTDPAKADTDGDGLTDSAELFEHHTDPNDADSDDDFFPDGLDYGLWGNPRQRWDNLLTRGLTIGLLLGVGVFGWFAVYLMPKRRHQEMQGQLRQLKQLTRQFRELIAESSEQFATSADPAELEITARNAYELFSTCKEAIAAARHHAASRWLRVLRRRNLATLRAHAAAVNQEYTQFTQIYLRRVEEFIFD